MRCSVILVFFSVFLVYSEQKSTPQDDSYMAAVVEYQVQSNVTANVLNYVKLIQDAAQQNADIVVFPEMTLTSGVRQVLVPIHGLLKEHPVPALVPQLYDEILVAISQAARSYQIYVVVNLQEGMDCTNAVGEYCPEAKEYVFNTNVVFDRNGAVIDRYRKINLFGEFTRMPALQPDLGVFTTDFGVTFGHYICFDLMFQVPAVQVVEKYNLTDIVFTTMWFSEMPYLTAVQIQQAYAYVMNVNFLGSGANNVRVGSAGSGIYSGKAGALVSYMPGLPSTRVLVAKVPKVPGQVTDTYPGPIYDDPSEHDNLVLISDPSLPSHTSRLLVQGFQEFTLVDKEVSCRFRVRLNQREGEITPRYRSFVQDGSNTYSRREVGVAACAVVACKNDDIKSCTYRFNKNEINTEIEELQIDMTTYRTQYNNTLQCDNVVYYPSSLRRNKFPLSPDNFTYTDSRHNDVFLQNGVEKNDGREHLTYRLNMPQNELITFGVWGRIYIKDVNHIEVITVEDINKYLDIEKDIYEANQNYKYRAAAFSGVRSFSGMATGGNRICSVFSCTGYSIETCGRRFSQYVENTTGIFEELTITAIVPTPILNTSLHASDSAFFPISLDVSIMPLNSQKFSYNENVQNNITVYTLSLNDQDAELYSFAIWGRFFDTDGEEATPSGDDHNGAANSIYYNVLLIPALATYVIFEYFNY